MFRSEEHIQKALVMWFRMKYPNAILTISPAGIRRGSALQRIKSGKDAKEMGYLKGTPDILIFHPIKEWKACLIEMKSEDGRVTPEQMSLMARLRGLGYYTAVCYGLDEGILRIDEYMKGEANERTP